eukprot:2236037-Prymnesium_polylepis.1
MNDGDAATAVCRRGLPASQATETLRESLRAAAGASGATATALAKDVGILVKLLRNPAEQPAEAKFRKIRTTNPTIARVLTHSGARDLLRACGFVGGADEFLELGDDDAESAVLSSAAAQLEAVQHMLQELSWLFQLRSAVPSLAAVPWSAEGAAKLLVQSCLKELHAPSTTADVKAQWVQRLYHSLSAPEMHECRQVMAGHIAWA